MDYDILPALMRELEEELVRTVENREEAFHVIQIVRDIVNKNPKRVRKELEEIRRETVEVYGVNLLASAISKALVHEMLEVAKFEDRHPGYTDFILALRDLKPHIFPWD